MVTTSGRLDANTTHEVQVAASTMANGKCVEPVESEFISVKSTIQDPFSIVCQCQQVYNGNEACLYEKKIFFLFLCLHFCL